MNTKKITSAEITPIAISSLPTRPTAPAAFGGKGYTAAEMKAAFDKLPLLVIERFNELLDEIESTEGSFSNSIPTGLGDGHTLGDMFRDIINGNFAGYIKVFGKSLTAELLEIKNTLAEIEARQEAENEQANL